MRCSYLILHFTEDPDRPRNVQRFLQQFRTTTIFVTGTASCHLLEADVETPHEDLLERFKREFPNLQKALLIRFPIDVISLGDICQ